MIKLLKTFGKGLLYVISFPFFVLALLLFGVFGIFLFLFQLVKSIICFFTGRKFFPELPEDRELRLKKEAAQAASESQNVIIDQPIESEPIATPLIAESNIEQQEETEPTIEDACFAETVEEKQEESLSDFLREEPLDNETNDSFEEAIEKEIDTTPEEIEVEEELEEYVPEGAVFSEEIDEEEDTEIGVDIDYNL